MSGGSSASRGIRRVLVRCPNWLGDTVMALPTIRGLRAAFPDAELCCLGPWAPSILETEPGLDRRLPYPRSWGARLDLARELRRAPADLAVLLTNSFESALHARLAGARRRVGYASDGRSWLLSDPVPLPIGLVHQVEAYLGLLRGLGVRPAPTSPSLAVTPARRTEARQLLGEAGVRPGERAVAVQLGAALGPSKLWRAERFAELATRLGDAGTPVVFLGTRNAHAFLVAIESRLGRPARALVGRDTPALLPALLAEFAVVVAPDSGPAHVAAAVGVPLVTLFGPTDPRLTAPRGEWTASLWRRPECAPCFQPRCPIDHRCMAAITVDDVVDAVRERLSPRAGEARAATPS